VPARAGWSHTASTNSQNTSLKKAETLPEETTPALCATPPPEGNNPLSLWERVRVRMQYLKKTLRVLI
jgi:hypothetical protein